jgi:uncharacterized protein (DUF427 family)
MARALWNGAIIAESDRFELVEGSVYFPPETVRCKYLKDSPTHTVCGWKGTASYYTVVVDGEENRDGAWYYPDPKPAAAKIKNHVAFRCGVQVER